MKSTLVFLATALLLSEANAEYIARIQCPAKVRLASGVVGPESVVMPFTPLVKDALLWLSGASAFDGPPEQLATLVPDAVKTTGSIERITWRFHGAYQQGKWLTCDYGGGSVRLQVRVDDRVSSCTAVSRRKKAPEGLSVEFTCD